MLVGLIRGPWVRSVVLVCAGMGGTAGGVFVLAHEALVDDSYIALAYARNLAVHGTWGLLPDEPSNTATSPLNVLLLAGLIALLRIGGEVQPVAALGVYYLAAALALAWCWMRLARELRLPIFAAVLGAGLAVVNPFVVSSIGLEPMLWAALLTGLLLAAIRGQPLVFGAFAGLLVLARLDMVVFVALLAVTSRGVRRGLPAAAALAAAIVLPWAGWSWWYFGSAIPDTFVIKTVQREFVEVGPGGLRGFDFGNGALLLAAQHPLPTLAAGVVAAAGVGVLFLALAGRLLGKDWALQFSLLPVFGIAGLLHYLGYLKLGVPPYIWYYAPLTVALSTVLAVGIGVYLCRQRERNRHGHAAVAVLFGVAALGGTVYADLAGRAVPWERPPMYGNWALPKEYQRIAAELSTRIGDAAVAGPGEIGALAYYCRCTILDQFSDRAALIPLIRERIHTAGPMLRRLLELNYSNLDPGPPTRPVRWALIWAPGHVPPGPDIWNVHSPALGDGHFSLHPLPEPPP